MQAIWYLYIRVTILINFFVTIKYISVTFNTNPEASLAMALIC